MHGKVEVLANNSENTIVYLTKVKINGIQDITNVESIITSDNLVYGTNDMYTQETGELYLYLPEGTRTITVKIDGVEYSSQVITSAENKEIVTTLY